MNKDYDADKLYKSHTKAILLKSLDGDCVGSDAVVGTCASACGGDSIKVCGGVVGDRADVCDGAVDACGVLGAHGQQNKKEANCLRSCLDV